MGMVGEYLLKRGKGSVGFFFSLEKLCNNGSVEALPLKESTCHKKLLTLAKHSDRALSTSAPSVV